MTFKDFKIILKNNLKNLILIPLSVSLIFFLISLNFPKSYITEGTFIIVPNIQKDLDRGLKYNYDGYYIDQISQGYSKTVIGLIETPEFKKVISEKISIDSNLQDLILLNFKSNFKEVAPRILVLSIKANSKSLSENMFKVYENELLNISNKLAPNNIFKIERLGNFTSSYDNSISVFIYLFVSYFFTLSIMLIIYYLKGVNNEQN